MRKLLICLILNLFIAYCEAQTIDSALDSPKVLKEEFSRTKVQQWQDLLNQWSGVVDSVKRRLSWAKNLSDTLFIDSALVFFSDLQSPIRDLSQILHEARLKEEIIRKKQNSNDTLGLVEIAISDSLKVQIPNLSDSLQRMENGLERLHREVEYLQESTLRRRDELLAIKTTSNTYSTRRQILKTMEKNWIKDGASLTYFDMPSWSNRLFVLLLSFFYFYWIFKMGRRAPEDPEELPIHKNDPLWIPILKALILFLILLPFTNLTLPVVVLEVSYLLIFIFLGLILYSELSVLKKRVLLFTFVYYAAIVVANLLLSESDWTKISAAVANLGGIYLLWSYGKRTDLDNPIGYLHKYTRTAIALGHFVAVVLLVMGYLNIARMWSLVSAIGLLQGLSLQAFRDMLLHDLEKQYEIAREESWFRRFDVRQMRATADRVIRFCCALLVVLVLLNGLHLTREAAVIFDKLFNSAHKLGNITFSYGNLLLAVLVIAVANWLQKNLKKIVDTPIGKEQHHKKLPLFPIFRLLIVVVGFLIGISILGLGIDKLTVIIGALSVGIGLGLQNIINNFVSGIFLVFEKPFKIGDYVELADKKGQVLEIGIRSSTLLTDQGARVIIPNGDLLSGRLVNWTFSDSDIRVNMQLSIEKGLELEEWKRWLREQIMSFEEVDKNIPIKIWTQSMTADNYQLSLQVGISNVGLIDSFKSRFLESIQKEMDARGIKIASS
ncbi:mechanosensitive ion channel [Sphingobacterium sp. DK4209]|uniref:Mechanosensitive ion channel n=1 Tax=Sphingobacterium zhuxiongii TaxID=2662364 RepID=A0A5Q0Q4C4_9SPHI|nr:MULTISPECIES: mechanosensitive ion channel domain-containing protein [unclassified Sphingobacterium]MVZ67434.1 mechanosensitive ion channel [Sphingobacterium sp. DK4209]QGA24867.1 mechanosensitive ion channel [Sphingobacterium sp. dk4302]